ncbi:MAG TPA: 30S ribosomal protein S20 [Ktedonobacterales bacterium]|nr:30S ribosomal protein S20 [Ktedonobacterales bacterium]
MWYVPLQRGFFTAMPNTKSAMKRMRVEKQRRERNHSIKTRVRTFVTKARKAIDAAPAEETTVEALREAISQLDRAVTKGVLHRNNASRRKSRLAQRLNKMLAETQEQES